jgi:hypothetical protein
MGAKESRQAEEIEITPEMIEAAVAYLEESPVGSLTFLVSNWDFARGLLVRAHRGRAKKGSRASVGSRQVDDISNDLAHLFYFSIKRRERYFGPGFASSVKISAFNISSTNLPVIVHGSVAVTNCILSLIHKLLNAAKRRSLLLLMRPVVASRACLKCSPCCISQDVEPRLLTFWRHKDCAGSAAFDEK